jgi:PAS domain S-box-containing protein
MHNWLSFLSSTESSTVGATGSPSGLLLPSGLVLTEAVADGVIAPSLLVIAAALFVYLRRQGRNLSETTVLSLFTLFLVASGLAYLASLLSLWLPVHAVEGVLKAATAIFALITAIVIWRRAPQLSRLPSRDRLQAEIVAHLRTLEELKGARHQLEERVEARTKELAEAKQRFEIALRGSPISVFSQDKDMRFVWTHNAPAGLTSDRMIGKTDAEVLPPEAANRIMAAKRKAMATGSSQELDIDFQLFGRSRFFYLLIEALRDEAGAIVGTTSVAVDVTERKSSEDQLRLLLRELTHRSKNLLAVIQAIARQTASRTKSVEDFLQHFSNRLVAIGCSHDLLVADDWHGASLRTLIERQVSAHTDHLSERISIDGENVMLKPEAIHNLGLALHELAINAEKYGALSRQAGRVVVRWRFSDDASELKLVWEERGGPPVIAPERSGFGRAMIETVMGQALESDVKLTFPPKGVRCVIVIPASQVASRG